MRNTPNMGLTGEYLQRCFGKFDFEGITKTLPNRTFDESLDLAVGEKTLRLKQVGPCHTQGDILVHCVEDRLMFTGDILFIEGHPILWVGSCWQLDFCMRLHAGTWSVEIIVPGMVPSRTRTASRAVRDYLVYIRDEARRKVHCGYVGLRRGYGYLIDAVFEIGETLNALQSMFKHCIESLATKAPQQEPFRNDGKD